jgi:hypothetical protein
MEYSRPQFDGMRHHPLYKPCARSQGGRVGGRSSWGTLSESRAIRTEPGCACEVGLSESERPHISNGHSEVAKRGDGSFRTESSAKEYLSIIQILASMILGLNPTFEL